MDKKIKGLRWRVAGVLTLDTINNYMDRMTLSVVIIQIQASLAISGAMILGLVCGMDMCGSRLVLTSMSFRGQPSGWLLSRNQSIYCWLS